MRSFVKRFFRNELNMKDLDSTWFRKSRIQSVIHCGAFDGAESEIYDDLGIQSRLWIEANSDLVAELRRKFSDSIFDQVCEAALWDMDNQVMDFHLASNLASSSLLRPKEHLTYVRDVSFKGALTVLTSRLDTTLLNVDFFFEKPCLLVLDIQGAELKALQGAANTLREIDFVYLEVSHHELYLNYPGWFGVDNFLQSQDFVLIDWSYSKSHSWGNALYAKREKFNKLERILLRQNRLGVTFFRIIEESASQKLLRVKS